MIYDYQVLLSIFATVFRSIAGFGIDWILSAILVRFILRLRRVHRQAFGLGYFLAAGLIA
jgi:hypothetical protein